VEHVDVAGGDEGVDTRKGGVLDRVPAGLNVLSQSARQTANNGGVLHVTDRFRDPPDRIEVSGTGDGKTGLDHVYP
jgi:hypothetical protein